MSKPLVKDIEPLIRNRYLINAKGGRKNVVKSSSFSFFDYSDNQIRKIKNDDLLPKYAEYEVVDIEHQRSSSRAYDDGFVLINIKKQEGK